MHDLDTRTYTHKPTVIIYDPKIKIKINRQMRIAFEMRFPFNLRIGFNGQSIAHKKQMLFWDRQN